MKFIETPLKGAFLIDIEKNGDDRGFFARVFCQNEFQEIGLSTEFKQVNTHWSVAVKYYSQKMRCSLEISFKKCILDTMNL